MAAINYQHRVELRDAGPGGQQQRDGRGRPKGQALIFTPDGQTFEWGAAMKTLARKVAPVLVLKFLPYHLRGVNVEKFLQKTLRKALQDSSDLDEPPTDEAATEEEGGDGPAPDDHPGPPSQRKDDPGGDGSGGTVYGPPSTTPAPGGTSQQPEQQQEGGGGTQGEQQHAQELARGQRACSEAASHSPATSTLREAQAYMAYTPADLGASLDLLEPDAGSTSPNICVTSPRTAGTCGGNAFAPPSSWRRSAPCGSTTNPCRAPPSSTRARCPCSSAAQGWRNSDSGTRTSFQTRYV